VSGAGLAAGLGDDMGWLNSCAAQCRVACTSMRLASASLHLLLALQAVVPSNVLVHACMDATHLL
jgi:hypothetical protein